MNNKADKFYKNKKYKKAFALFEKEAAAGDAHAQYSLGRMYAKGEGIEKDSREAMMWLRKAAEQGLSDAQTGIDEYLKGLWDKLPAVDALLKALADEESAAIFPPASDEDITECQMELKTKGFAPIPGEYLAFLRKCNGFIWGLTFYGTKPISNYNGNMYDDIVTANKDFIKYYDYFSHCLLIGESFSYKYVYDTEKEIFSTWMGGYWEDHASFEALFVEATSNN